MKKKYLVGLACEVMMFGVVGMAEAAYLPIDLSAVANYHNDGSGFPSGSQTLDGKPFSLNNSWFSHIADKRNASVSLNIPVNVYGVESVYTLINTVWGQSYPNTYAFLEFFGSDNGYLRVDLYGNKHIRDYSNSRWTNSLDSNLAKEIWSNGTGLRLDMQTFVLPPTFSDELLLSVKLTDNGAWEFQRSFIEGVTVSHPVPVPATTLLFGSVFAGLIGSRIKRKKQ